jgi:hypothetical protein
MITISHGNGKISKNCLIFNLPTKVCNGENKQCKKCYALKAEYLYPTVLPYRINNYNKSKSKKFVENISKQIKSSKKKYFRIHEAGDFYSQIYINKWIEIIRNNPEKMFFAFTKKYRKFDFTEMEKLPNFNLIISNPNGIKNYGSIDYCQKLVEEEGFFLCPDGLKENIKCMETCFACFTEKKVCFKQH